MKHRTLKKATFKSLIAGVMISASLAASAGDAVDIQVTQGSNTATLGFSSLTDMFDFFNNTSTITSVLPWYDTKADSKAVMNNIGITFIFDVSDQGNTVKMDVPSIGFSQTYAGDRDDSLSRLKEDLKANYGKIQTKLASTTPNSLVAGNPNSVQTQMAMAQFDMGFAASSSSIVSPTTAATATTSGAAAGVQSQTSSNLAGLGLRFGRYSQGDKRIQTASLPLSYSWRFDDNDDRRRIYLAAPLTAGQLENAKIFAAQVALGVGIPINKEWAVTPVVGYGVTGSVDLLQASQQVNVSITSSYTLALGDGYALSFGNMVGYFATVKLKIKDYESDIDLKNFIFRNGLLYSIPLKELRMLGEGTTVELSAINTVFTGSELYARSMNEIGITIGTDKRARGLKSYLRAGVSGMFAKDSNGVAVNVGYWF
ncbi:hypothetical protein [Ideonella sp.]|uniref:hypothetical protein n=1 Tax=Ideonella sp. TaxID=1929293 RepID=UPI003BB764CE